MNFVTLAGKSPFAGFGRKSTLAAKAEDEKDEEKKDSKAEDEKKDDEKDEEKSKKSKAEDEKKDDEKDEEKSKKSKAEDKEEDGDEDEKKSKKSKSEGEDDEPEARAANEARIRASERARIRAIFESEAGQANLEAAYELAVNSDMPSGNAIAILRSVGPAKAETPRETLRDRMAGTKQPDIGAGGPEKPSFDTPEAFAAAVTAADKKRRGEK
jgi:hypothetical protein